MPQLDRSLIKQRVFALRQSGNKQLANYLKRRVGTADMLLLEKGNKGYLSGYEKAQLVSSDKHEPRAGDLLAVNILSAANGVVQVTPLCS